MKQKKPSSLTRILGYAGGHKNLTILGCILSALSAVLGQMCIRDSRLPQGLRYCRHCHVFVGDR